MDIAQKIRTIENVVRSLSRMEARHMQLVLRQHGVNTYEWEDDLHDYLINQVEDLAEDRLVQLDAFAADDVDGEVADVVNRSPSWSTKSPLGVFLSHKWEDAEFAGEVAERLRDWYGIEAFVAHRELRPSARWREAIEAALSSCHALVAFMHPEFRQSAWCDQEVGWALGRRLPCIVARSTEAGGTRYGFIEQLQELSYDPEVKAGTSEPPPAYVARKVYEVLVEQSRLRPLIASALLQRIQQTTSFHTINHLWKAMAALEYSWTRGQLVELRDAARANEDIKQAFAVPSDPHKALSGYRETGLAAEESRPSPDPWSSAVTDEPPF